jgi:hypothetical protein
MKLAPENELLPMTRTLSEPISSLCEALHEHVPDDLLKVFTYLHVLDIEMDRMVGELFAPAS